MTQSSDTIPKAAVHGTASGMFFMAFFGTALAYTGSMGLQGLGNPLVIVAALIIGLALILGGVVLVRSSRNLTN